MVATGTTTSDPASEAPATLLHTRVDDDDVVTVFNTVQPAGSVIAAVVFELKNSNNASPGCTVDGTVTECTVALSCVEVCATNEIGAANAGADDTTDNVNSPANNEQTTRIRARKP